VRKRLQAFELMDHFIFLQVLDEPGGEHPLPGRRQVLPVGFTAH
jgi:hypothetical protein